jgi:hypothetical protein
VKVYSNINGDIEFNLRRGRHKYVYAYLDPTLPPQGMFFHAPYYVGCGSNERVRKHFTQSKKENPNYKKVNFEVIQRTKSILARGINPIVVILGIFDLEYGREIEAVLIDKYGKTLTDTGTLLNRYSSTEGRVKGKPVIREKSRRNMSVSAIEKFKRSPMSQETKEKMSVSRKGNTSLSTLEAKTNRFMTMITDTLIIMKDHNLDLNKHNFNKSRPSPKHIRFERIFDFISEENFNETLKRAGTNDPC